MVARPEKLLYLSPQVKSEHPKQSLLVVLEHSMNRTAPAVPWWYTTRDLFQPSLVSLSDTCQGCPAWASTFWPFTQKSLLLFARLLPSYLPSSRKVFPGQQFNLPCYPVFCSSLIFFSHGLSKHQDFLFMYA